MTATVATSIAFLVIGFLMPTPLRITLRFAVVCMIKDAGAIAKPLQLCWRYESQVATFSVDHGIEHHLLMPTMVQSVG